MKYISCFSGIEAASVAAGPLGWEPVAFSEIDKFASAVLAYHYPQVPNLGDITKINWSEYNGRVGLVCGGSPCQAFSVSGLRKSLEDPRGNLTLEYMRAVHAVKPKWVLWENVPGTFSAAGNPFGCFMAGLAGYDSTIQPAGGRWANSGFLVAKDEASYSLAWRVLDAQYFGVPQRRHRIFLVGHLGKREWWKPLEVLFERPRKKRHIEESRAQREKTSANVGECFEAIGVDLYNGTLTGALPATLTTNSSAGQSGPSVYMVRTAQTGANGWGVDEKNAYTLDRTNGQAVAIGSHWDNPSNPHPTLNQSHNIGGIGASNQELFSQRGAGLVMACGQGGAQTQYGDKAGTLAARYDASHCADRRQNVVAFAHNQGGELRTSGIANTVTTSGNASARGTGKLLSGSVVRRLTPTECERLQNFPDGYTRIPYRGKPPELCPDGPRYKALGNSWAVCCARWIFERINKVDKGDSL